MWEKHPGESQLGVFIREVLSVEGDKVNAPKTLGVALRVQRNVSCHISWRHSGLNGLARWTPGFLYFVLGQDTFFSQCFSNPAPQVYK